MINRLFILSFFLLLGLLTSAQTDQNSAMALYNDGKYKEAAVIFEKLYRKQPKDLYYDRLLSCYKELEQLDEAEKLIQKRMRKVNDAALLVDLGYYQKLQDHTEEANESFQNALDAIRRNPGLAFSISDRFSKFGLYKEALEAFEVGESVNPNLQFNYQKGLLYAELGDMENMYREYLELIEFSPNYFNNVKSRIARNINDDPENKANAILKKQLIKKIQETQNPLFSELLIWLYTEELEFGKALRQLKALDKREGNRDSEIYSLGEKALNKKEYLVALDCFDFVVEKGEMSGFYQDAVYKRLEAKRNQTEANPLATKKDFEKLVTTHYDALDDLEGDEKYIYTKRDIAQISYFDLHKKDTALAILNGTINRFQNSFKRPVAVCNLLLGNILLAEGQAVEAIFKYMQIERAFAGTPLGDLAKFMKGMVAYYTADFPWALNQFEVLKSSTTKLISNDALTMALLITDNSTEDTLYQGLTYYASADLYQFRKMPDSALYQLEMLMSVFPDHELFAEATLMQAKIWVQQAKFNAAVNGLENLLAKGKGDIYSDDALMLLGEIYTNHIGDKEKAMTAYEKVLFDHPGSTFVPEARRRYRKLRGDIL